MAEFQGVRCPAKGNYRQVSIGELNDVRYEFEVISVESLPDDAREHWLPPWPPSTVVRDQTKGDARCNNRLTVVSANWSRSSKSITGTSGPSYRVMVPIAESLRNDAFIARAHYLFIGALVA